MGFIEFLLEEKIHIISMKTESGLYLGRYEQIVISSCLVNGVSELQCLYDVSEISLNTSQLMQVYGNITPV